MLQWPAAEAANERVVADMGTVSKTSPIDQAGDSLDDWFMAIGFVVYYG